MIQNLAFTLEMTAIEEEKEEEKTDSKKFSFFATEEKITFRVFIFLDRD